MITLQKKTSKRSLTDPYARQEHMLVAVDCIIFGFDDRELKILLMRRGLEPEMGKWSLMGGFVNLNESLPEAATRVLEKSSGLKNIYMEELHSFTEVDRDPKERTISIAYFALININNYKQQLTQDYHAEWFSLKKFPKLIFDHNKMVDAAKARLRYKAAFHSILFELLPDKFTIPQLQNLYEAVYEITFDKGNFNRKVLSTKLLVKQAEKNKTGSKKGAFYYKLDKRKYIANFNAVLNIIPNPDALK